MLPEDLEHPLGSRTGFSPPFSVTSLTSTGVGRRIFVLSHGTRVSFLIKGSFDFYPLVTSVSFLRHQVFFISCNCPKLTGLINFSLAALAYR